MHEHEVSVCKILDNTALLPYFNSYPQALFAAALAHRGGAPNQSPDEHECVQHMCHQQKDTAP